MPSRVAVTMAANPVPPAPTTPTKANCEPPVNINADRAQVCQASSPDATPKAPNEISAVSSERLHALMPVHSDNPQKDRELVDGAVRFGFAGFAAKLYDALEPEPVRAELMARAAA